MKNSDQLIKRYYRGETSLKEEQELKAAWQRGEYPDDPALAFGCETVELPAGLSEKLEAGLRQRQSLHHRSSWWITAGSIAAMLVLILTFRGLNRHPLEPSIQLTDNLKKERFEHALRTIGDVLQEKTPQVQKVLYEDHKLIIAIE